MLRTYKHELLIEGVKKVEFEYIICQERKKVIISEEKNIINYSCYAIFLRSVIYTQTLAYTTYYGLVELVLRCTGFCSLEMLLYSRHWSVRASGNFVTSAAILKRSAQSKRCNTFHAQIIHSGDKKSFLFLWERNICCHIYSRQQNVGAKRENRNASGGCWQRTGGNCCLCWGDHVCIWEMDRSYFGWTEGKKWRNRYVILRNCFTLFQ